MDASLDHLRTLVAVVDEGTFDGASVALGVTPSAISQRIKALETAAGRVLVTRSKPVRATAPGEIVLRLARTTVRLAEDAERELGLSERGSYLRLPIAVNADSLATWFLPALARFPSRHRAVFDLHVEDQDLTAQLFAAESVLAAVTADAEPVAGCRVTALGAMRYLACASPDFADTYFSHGIDDAALADAPVVVFNRKDRLQHRFLREVTGESHTPPTHYVPSSADFVRGIQLGLGWALVPEPQYAALPDPDSLVELAPAHPIDIPLYWQVWPLDSPPLRALTDVVKAGAAESLRPVPA